jgi:hypothetical protein
LRLGPGTTRTVRLNVPPDAFPVGDAIVLASVTTGGITDAVAGPQVSVAPPVVRLTGGPTAPPAKPLTRGKRVSLAIALTNEGNVATSATTAATFGVGVSTDGTAAGVVFSTGVAVRLRLARGRGKSQKLALTFPADVVPAGNYQLRVTVSAERNETNGEVLALIPVTFV